MFCELEKKSIIKITGQDALVFLQGLITNDIKKASKDTLIYALMLTPQGKFLYDFFIQKIEDGYLLEIPKTYQEEIVKKLNFYKLKAKVEISQSPLKVFVIWENISLGLKDPRGVFSRLYSQEFPKDAKGSYEEYNLLRIQNTVISGEEDLISGQSFPLQFNMNEMNAIDYLKGCYVGQEVTARSHHRGKVKKQIKTIISDGIFEEKLPLTQKNVEIGQITSFEKNFALAQINIEDLKQEEKIFCGKNQVKFF